MSEPVKIAEDLQELHDLAKAVRHIVPGFAKYDGPYIAAANPNRVIALIERVSAAEAALALAKKDRARLKAPVSDEEINAFTKVIAVPSWMRGAFIDCLNAMIRARSKAPDGAQEAEGARDE